LQQRSQDLPGLGPLQPSADRIAMKLKASGNLAYWHALQS
jgi:hypothetical protein